MGYIKERESTGHVYGLDLKGGGEGGGGGKAVPKLLTCVTRVLRSKDDGKFNLICAEFIKVSSAEMFIRPVVLSLLSA